MSLESEPRVKALVVEDSAPVRELLIRLLQVAFPINWEFVEAGDGVEGLAKMDPRSVQLVFLDWEMPRMGGLEFMRKLRERGNADHIPVVMVTGRNLVGDIQRALDRYRVDCYITKPIGVDDLKRRLQKVLDRVLEREEAPPASLWQRLLGA